MLPDMNDTNAIAPIPFNDSQEPKTRDDYRRAGQRANTVRTYQAALRHYERVWQGRLPATPDQIADYLVAFADKHKPSTLKNRLSALSRWHNEHGFPNPVSTPVVRAVLKGVRVEHATPPAKARPLSLATLKTVVDHLERAAVAAGDKGDHGACARALRDRALFLLGFWKGFRADDLSEVSVDRLEFTAEEMRIYFPKSKGDRGNLGVWHQMPVLAAYCPVQACQDWLRGADISSGPLFRGITRWGVIGDTGMHPGSIVDVLRRALAAAGVENAESYSSHSLRRGLASWADSQGWSPALLMKHVGWKSIITATGYIDPSIREVGKRIDRALGGQARG